MARNIARVIGFETLNVGGTTVSTIHVHIDTTTTGSAGGGTSPADYWFSRQNWALIRNTGSIHGNGGAHYTETYDLALTSLHPRT